MKNRISRFLWLLAVLALFASCTAHLTFLRTTSALASGYDGESVLLQATDKLSTRNGPGTKYRDTGTYDLRGEYVTVLTREEDENGVCWVECEFTWRGELMRAYTGLKRFKCDDESEIFYALPWYFDAKALRTVPARYGPGEEYAVYDKLTMDKGQKVSFLRLENEWAQVEWTTTKQSYRVWVPLDAIDCPNLYQ